MITVEPLNVITINSLNKPLIVITMNDFLKKFLLTSYCWCWCCFVVIILSCFTLKLLTNKINCIDISMATLFNLTDIVKKQFGNVACVSSCIFEQIFFWLDHHLFLFSLFNQMQNSNCLLIAHNCRTVLSKLKRLLSVLLLCSIKSFLRLRFFTCIINYRCFRFNFSVKKTQKVNFSVNFSFQL